MPLFRTADQAPAGKGNAIGISTGGADLACTDPARAPVKLELEEGGGRMAGPLKALQIEYG